jgi:hypothetical protein
VVHLNASHQGGDFGHPVHFTVVVSRGFEGSGREEFESYGDAECGSPAAFGQHHASLTTRAQPLQKRTFGRPLNARPLEQSGVTLLQSRHGFAGGAVGGRGGSQTLMALQKKEWLTLDTGHN